MMMNLVSFRAYLIVLLLGFWLPGAEAAGSKPLDQVETLVVIYLENHSFDNLYGQFPGADGLAQAPKSATLQVDEKGKPFQYLPRVMDSRKKPIAPDERFPERLPNQPFNIDAYAPANTLTGDLVHRFYQHQAQINGGRMNRFAGVSDAGGLTMGYYDGKKLRLWDYARRYTLADHFFSASFGGSYINHMWLVCACTPRQEQLPKTNVIRLDDSGQLIDDGSFTTDGYAVNTVFSSYSPRSPKSKDGDKILSPQTLPTIGDRLSDKHVDWSWFAGGWNDAVAGKPDESYQFHHQPFTYFKRYADGSPDRVRHLKDEADFLFAIQKGTLPPVSFYKPLGRYNEHPQTTDLFSSDEHAAKLLAMLEKSPQWPHMMVVVTYDEYGGFWDHVAPPKIDRWGPGNRVPALIISPFSKGGGVDHTVYDTTSILKLIESRWDLEPLGERDAKAANLGHSLRFSH